MRIQLEALLIAIIILVVISIIWGVTYDKCLEKEYNKQGEIESNRRKLLNSIKPPSREDIPDITVQAYCDNIRTVDKE